MKIKNLTDVTDEQLHKAFISAFSDYEIKIDMPFEKFRSITYAKDYNPELSLGSFDENELTGFILSGFRVLDGRPAVYDIATGVTAGNQGRGIGSLLIENLLESLKCRDISSFYLEVLENNEQARHLYEKYGFKVHRRLACYEIKRREIANGAGLNCKFETGSDSAALRKANPFFYHSYNPTWQNMVETWGNSKQEHEVVTLKDDGKLVSYGIIQKMNGSVLQFGVHPDYRGDGAAEVLLNRLIEHSEAETIRFINVEEGVWLCGFLEASGFKISVNQFEMIYEF
ncbi:MAG: GNAT family N-acetyltransferase [Spirochaetales bacterium]|nr:GNAT family N-acetyltransferase [Spirochaetales bacterium]